MNLQEVSFDWFFLDEKVAEHYYRELLSAQTSQRVCPGAEPFIEDDTGRVVGLRVHRSHLPILGLQAPTHAIDLPYLGFCEDSLRTHQETARSFITQRRSCILADDMGLGKTLSVLACFDTKAFIACPLSVVDVWANELAQWRPDLRVLVVRNRAVFDKQPKVDFWQRYDVIVVPYSQHGLAGYFAQGGFCGPPNILICDEAHRLTHKGVTWSQSLRVICPRDHVVLLSATPMRHGLASLWGLLDFASTGAWGTRNEFLTRYMGATQNRYSQWAVDPQQPTEQAELALRLTEVVLKRSQEQAGIPRPENNRRVVNVEIDGYALQAKIKNYSGGMVKKKSAQQLQYLNWLRQEVGKQKVREVFNRKTIQSLDQNRTVIWVWHRELLNEIVMRLQADEVTAVAPDPPKGLIVNSFGVPIDVLRGDTPTKDRARVIAEWADVERRDPRVLVASVAAACEGLSLKNCDQAWFLEFDWSPVTVMQAEKRHHRAGNIYKEVETVYFRATRNEKPIATDDAMFKALQAKIEASERVLGKDSQREQIDAMLLEAGTPRRTPEQIMSEYRTEDEL